MITSIGQARDEIMEYFHGVWTTNAPNVRLLFAGKREEAPNEVRDSWARLSVQHNTGNLATLGGAGNRRYRQSGIIELQIFTKVGDGLAASDTLSQIFLNAFMVNNLDHIWFTNARVNELGSTSGWHQTNCLVEFNYDFIV